MKRNLFDNIPDDLPEERFSVLAETENVKIERIVSDGHSSPKDFRYDQEQDEWVLLVSGSAVLSIEKDAGVEQVELTTGDHLFIPAHTRHRIESTCETEKTIWLAVFC